MTEELILTNARVVLRDEVLDGTVRVENGRIAAVDTGHSALPAAVDCESDYLLPGFVELHTDNLEKHFSPRPGVAWPSLPAAVAHDSQLVAAGITTVFDAISLGDLFSESARLAQLDRMVEAVSHGREAGIFRADHRIHLRCELSFHGVLDLFEAHGDAALAGLVSLMDHTPGQRQFVDLEKYRLYYQRKYDLDDEELAAFTERQQRAHAEYSESHRAILVERCRARGLPIASHDDATREHIREAAAYGAVISEFPTTVEAAAEARAHGMKVLMGGPNLVLGRSHSGNVSAWELVAEGLLDIVSSDYVPGSLLQAVFDLTAGEASVPLPEAVAMATANPAAAAGLNDRGAVAEGLKADLLRVSDQPGLPVVITAWRDGRRVN